VKELGRVHLAALGLDALGEAAFEGLAGACFTSVTATDRGFALRVAATRHALGDLATFVFPLPLFETATEGQSAGLAACVVAERIAGTDAVLDATVEEAVRTDAAGVLTFAAGETALEERCGCLTAVVAAEGDLVLADVEQSECLVPTSLFVDSLIETGFEELVSPALAGVGQTVGGLFAAFDRGAGKGEEEHEARNEGCSPR
jgi:hypothetical protein